MSQIANHFEISFLDLSENEDSERLNSLYEKLMSRAETDPCPPGVHWSLRDFINARYAISELLRKRERYVNLYSVEEPECEQDYTRLFFTGLYTGRYFNGSKDELFITFDTKSKEWRISAWSELQQSRMMANIVGNIIICESFGRLLDDESLAIASPELPLEIKNELSEEERRSLMEKLRIINSKEGEGKPIKSDNWLHILIDGIKRVPDDVFKSLYKTDKKTVDKYLRQKLVLKAALDIDGGRFADFINHQQKMIEAITRALETNNLSELPVICYIKSVLKDRDDEPKFNYLLPIDFFKRGKPDFCVVLAMVEGKCKLKTLLNMDMAYNDIMAMGRDRIDSLNWWRHRDNKY